MLCCNTPSSTTSSVPLAILRDMWPKLSPRRHRGYVVECYESLDQHPQNLRCEWKISTNAPMLWSLFWARLIRTTIVAFHPMCGQKNVPIHPLVMKPIWSNMHSNDHWDHFSHHISQLDSALLHRSKLPSTYYTRTNHRSISYVSPTNMLEWRSMPHPIPIASKVLRPCIQSQQ